MKNRTSQTLFLVWEHGKNPLTLRTIQSGSTSPQPVSDPQDIPTATKYLNLDAPTFPTPATSVLRLPPKYAQSEYLNPVLCFAHWRDSSMGEDKPSWVCIDSWPLPRPVSPNGPSPYPFAVYYQWLLQPFTSLFPLGVCIREVPIASKVL